jgi:hypothetical protein
MTPGRPLPCLRRQLQQPSLLISSGQSADIAVTHQVQGRMCRPKHWHGKGITEARAPAQVQQSKPPHSATYNTNLLPAPASAPRLWSSRTAAVRSAAA